MPDHQYNFDDYTDLTSVNLQYDSYFNIGIEA